MPVLRGLEKRALTESTPEFDRLMADCGSLLTEAPWQPELLKFTPWTGLPDDYQIPDDYELPPLSFHRALARYSRLVSAQSDTQLMRVIS